MHSYETKQVVVESNEQSANIAFRTELDDEVYEPQQIEAAWSRGS
jgi:hypothetical protein